MVLLYNSVTSHVILPENHKSVKASFLPVIKLEGADSALSIINCFQNAIIQIQIGVKSYNLAQISNL